MILLNLNYLRRLCIHLKYSYTNITEYLPTVTIINYRYQKASVALLKERNSSVRLVYLKRSRYYVQKFCQKLEIV